ncbi:glycerol-3-phosphate 1-O-acyltransferase PlsY [Rubeoparvulum massiliense]|uniref:glycerol-3-phosphate 1-O-acyltransferase PlsY n=1 Tax=Rubeoparvulum massiliense TaxID=1631346 RepID=UPI00065E1048|nr:glycerol-3-phosphate 1-O-acyltransferase PlsY [Rubeoparvulum massiliense]
MIILAYLIGSISSSYIIGKAFKKIDIRQYGSGNAGATNTLRVMGIGPAILVLLLDVLKGIVTIFMSRYLFQLSDVVSMWVGFFTILGHNYPIYFGFRGGKGVATTIGVFATLALIPSLIAGALAILAIVITRYVSLGSLLFAILTPIMMAFLDVSWQEWSVGLLIALFVMWRHRGNIQRLRTGNERRLGEKSYGSIRSR